MEKCIFKHMYNYFRDNDLIYTFQSGFLPGCSTTHHLVHLYHSISEAFDKGLKVQMVFGDISKVFDKVWHAGLLFKLKNMGITEELLAWISNYLCDRKQRVVLQGESSCWADINAGVPQGSVIGPLLLLVYINDMEEGLTSKLTLFANDNLLLSILNCHIINSQILNSDLEKLEAWAQQLQNIPYSKHLGVILQQNLKWDKHFEEISVKANKRLDILNLLSFKLSRNSLEILYFTFVRSVLEYSHELFSNATKENLELFDKIQKRAGKIVSGAIRGTSSIKIYTELSWESLQSRRENKMIILYSDILHDRTPSYLKPIIPQTVKETSQGRYNLRNNSNINQTNTRTEIFRKSYIPATTQFWNNLDDSIKDLTSKESLKQILKRNKPNKKIIL